VSSTLAPLQSILAHNTVRDTTALVELSLKRPAAERVGWLAGALGESAPMALQALASHVLMRPMDGSDLVQLEPDFGMASFAECQRRGCVIARWRKPRASEIDGETLVFICQDPIDLDTQQWFEPLLERQSPERLLRVLVRHEDFSGLMAGAESTLRAMDTIRGDHGTATAQDGGNLLQLSMASIESTANATVRLVDSTLYDALKSGASDIHFEVQQKALQIKYRLDGVLQAIKRIESLDTAHQVISRVKVLADLDIAEQRIPQDGRFRVVLDKREIDFRVSIMPNMQGEDAVLRVLDRKHLTGQFESLTLDTLSFEDDVKAFIRRVSHLPYGLLLVTGPTGSGKTTTLYAAISEINTGLDKIITIEDPIEYQLAGVLQIPVNEKKGLTFAKGLRSILRHDPDKIMVGEIRDSETAQISVQAALTGHQVFTTVHANNVFDVIGRFSNMGVDSYSLVAALTGIMAQRLVRTVCPRCTRPSDVETSEIARGLDSFDAAQKQTVQINKAVGCESCRGTGYKGRMAIAETLPIDDEMRDLLVQHAPISAVKKLAQEKGFRSLRYSAVSLALRGFTTVDEINRVAPIA
jgi:general secretion pathway protein E